jgi:hypothetical protein
MYRVVNECQTNMIRIIVGVKYCFRYNARNRALRNGEEVDPINLENMPTRPHRRRREKKLMTMDEVNERFPLTKYKNWVATRAMEGLPTEGGVDPAAPSRAGSVRDVDGAIPSSPVGTKHSVNTRPPTAASGEISVTPTSNAPGGTFGDEKKSMDVRALEKEPGSPTVEEHHRLEETETAGTVNKHPTTTSEDDDDDDDHIHTAVPPELLTSPGDSCAICIDTLEEDDDIRGLTCGHAFHAGCLDPWLTSRRACCPLCKADYYTPKPRPEGEAAAEAERAARRSRGTPQPPATTWAGLRGNPRLILPGRFMTPPSYAGDGVAYEGRGSRAERRAAQRELRERIAARRESEAAQAAGVDGAAQNSNQAAPSRWRPTISNPFRNMRMPAIPGRARQGAAADAEPSPSQLEAGNTVR